MGRWHPKTANVRGASIEIEREYHSKQGKILVIRVIGRLGTAPPALIGGQR
jgi:hypothetical protein